MQPPRVRFTVRRMMTWVAIAAFASLAISTIGREGSSNGERAVAVVASVVAGAYGVGAMRRPWVFLFPLIVVWLLPTVQDASLDVFTASVLGCFVGWIIGAPAGWISRWLTGADKSVASSSESAG